MQDQAIGYRDGGLSPGYPGADIRVSSYITTDLNLTTRIDDKFTVYANVTNLFDRLPPVDSVTYGAFFNNSAQAGNNIFGRQFSMGTKVNF